MTNRGRAAKAKGSGYERVIAQKYVDYGIDPYAKRMPLSGAISYMKGDIKHAHNIAIPFKFIDEVKRQETINWYQWWLQATSQCGQGEEPVLHFKKSNSEPFTLIRTDTFFSLLGTIVELYNKKPVEETETKVDYNSTTAINKLKFAIDVIKQAEKLIKK